MTNKFLLRIFLLTGPLAKIELGHVSPILFFQY